MSPTKIFLTVANSHPEFAQALEVIKKNSKGKSWLIGGCVCRSIIEGLYGIPMPKETDFDVIVEHLLPLTLPNGWTSKVNSYGNPKLIGPAYSINMIPQNLLTISCRV